MNYLTFDIEDWFHLLDVPFLEDPNSWDKYESRINIGFNKILDICDKSNVKAIFFVLGWIADKYPNIVKSIDNRGHLIGSHGYHHKLVYKLTPKEFENDLVRSINSIEKVLGKKIKSFRAPGFSIGPNEDWAFNILAKNKVLPPQATPVSIIYSGLDLYIISCVAIISCGILSIGSSIHVF